MTLAVDRPRRSVLFVPGTNAERIANALESGADAVCIDLEDAVADDLKEEARRVTLSLFDSPRSVGCEVVVRINPLDTRKGLRDLIALLSCTYPPDALMLPKLKDAGEVELLDRICASAGSSYRFYPIIETAAALENALAIAAASDRNVALIFGAADLSADLRCQMGWPQLHYARSRVAHAAAASSIDAVDVPYLLVDDKAGLGEESAASSAQGFTGKACIHPNHIPTIHACFAPSDDQIAWAKRVKEAYDNCASGLVVLDGALIEKPVIRAAHRILRAAEVQGGNSPIRRKPLTS